MTYFSGIFLQPVKTNYIEFNSTSWHIFWQNDYKFELEIFGKMSYNTKNPVSNFSDDTIGWLVMYNEEIIRKP